MDPVLPIAIVEYDKSVELTGDVSNFSAEQYLSWVREQSQRLPVVFRSEKVVEPVEQTKTMPVIEQVLSCPDEFLPDIEWEREMIHNYSLLRQVIESQETAKERKVVVPQLKDRLGWLQFCLGDEVDSSSVPSSSSASKVPSTIINLPPPEDDNHHTNTDTNANTNDNETEEVIKRRKLDLANSMGIHLEEENTEMVEEAEEEEEDDDDDDEEDEQQQQMQLEGLAATLQSLTNSSSTSNTNNNNCLPVWAGLKAVKPTISLLLQFDQVLTQKVLKYLIDYQESIPIYSFGCGLWIYALLARIEKPIHRDMVASIRQLYRVCCRLRHTVTTTVHRQGHLDNKNHHIPSTTTTTSMVIAKEVAEEEEEDGEIMEESVTIMMEQCEEEGEQGEEEGEQDEEWGKQLAALNILIAITGYYFGQGERYQDFVSYHDYLQSTALPVSDCVTMSNDKDSAVNVTAAVIGSREDDVVAQGNTKNNSTVFQFSLQDFEENDEDSMEAGECDEEIE